MRDYIAELPARVSGIPCLVGVTSYYEAEGSYSYHAASSDDYYGYTDMSYEILDRRGRHAPWLEKKLTDYDREQIERLIKDYRSDDNDY
jgi:hypothetical protein